MQSHKIEMYKILPKVGYRFMSLDSEEPVYSTAIYTNSPTNIGSWTEVIDPDAMGTSENPYPYNGKISDGVDNAFYYDSENNKTYVFMNEQYIDFDLGE